MVRRTKTVAKVKSVQVKISTSLKTELDRIIREWKSLGINLSYAEASEIYRRAK